MTNLEGKQALSRELNIEWSDIANNQLFSADDIQHYLNIGCLRAWDFKFWDFTERVKTGTLTSTEVSNGYVDQPNIFSTGGIFLLVIDGEEYRKLTIQDYRKFFEDNPNDDEKLWAEFTRRVFFNSNVATAGTLIDLYGKEKFTQLSGDSDLMPFSPDADDNEYSGNMACVLLGYAEVLESEKKKQPDKAKSVRADAYGMLKVLWDNFSEGRALEQTNRPMFDVPDFFAQGHRSDNSIGRFNT